ncbi:MAG: biopolymer transporter ExbD [Rudaea sp.]|nr:MULTISPECIES: biopolymer transporter ExbD [unclassified Rudaea]MBN8885323.1 biopolymer transporter ExbD [Rudaea sp.]MBR0347303.1 biopolymer transporter ExbD [Rudaea sp.]
MAFSAGNSGGGAMADINVTPLVDVMLVLLIIFMITAPMLTHRIKIDLPQPTNNPPPQVENPPDPITLSVRSSGQFYWNDQLVSEEQLQQMLTVTSKKSPQPELQIQADKTAKYQLVATVMADAKNAGMTKIGFQPARGAGQ